MLSIRRARPSSTSARRPRVYIKNIKVEKFDIHKKQFQVTEAKRARRQATPAPAQKKMVFLVFDAVFSPYNLLSKAKAIAETVIAISDQTAQYVLLTIEPFAGLHYILGPTRDLKLLAQDLKKCVEGRKAVYVGDDLMPPPGVGGGGVGGARYGILPSKVQNRVEANAAETNAWRDKRHIASSYTSALMTLDVVLGLFKDYSKVIYLYSCGIPGDALLDRMEITEPNGTVEAVTIQ